jgi:hypothetical protein
MPETSTPSAPTSTAPAQSSAPLTQAGSSPVIDNQGSSPDPAASRAGTQAPAQAAKAEAYEIKFNGKTVKLTKDELLQHASLGLASDERFREGANLKRQAETVIGKLKDPKGVIAALQDPALGLSKDQIKAAFEEWYAREYIDPEQMTPEQIKLRQAEERLKKYEEDEKSREEKKRQEHLDSLTTQAREEIQNQIIEALNTGALPKTNFTMRRLAYWIERNNANNFNAPTAVLVAQVKKDFDSTLREMAQASDGDVLVKLMGDEIIKKIRKYDLDQLKAAREKRNAPINPSSPAPTQQESNRAEPVDVSARLRELQRTGRF